MANYNTPDNHCLFIPYDTMALLRDIKHPDFIVWTPVSGMARDQAVKQVRATLGTLHNFSQTDDKAVFILPFNQQGASSCASSSSKRC